MIYHKLRRMQTRNSI